MDVHVCWVDALELFAVHADCASVLIPDGHEIALPIHCESEFLLRASVAWNDLHVRLQDPSLVSGPRPVPENHLAHRRIKDVFHFVVIRCEGDCDAEAILEAENLVIPELVLFRVLEHFYVRLETYHLNLQVSIRSNGQVEHQCAESAHGSVQYLLLVVQTHPVVHAELIEREQARPYSAKDARVLLATDAVIISGFTKCFDTYLIACH